MGKNKPSIVSKGANCLQISQIAYANVNPFQLCARSCGRQQEEEERKKKRRFGKFLRERISLRSACFFGPASLGLGWLWHLAWFWISRLFCRQSVWCSCVMGSNRSLRSHMKLVYLCRSCECWLETECRF